MRLVSYQRAAALQRGLGDQSREARAWGGAGEAHAGLGRFDEAAAFRWCGTPPTGGPSAYTAQLHTHGGEVPATAELLDDELHVRFTEPMRRTGHGQGVALTSPRAAEAGRS